MDPAERRQQRAAALLEYEEARRKLDQLRSRAWKISDDLSEIACWLSDARDIQHGPAISRQRLRDEKIAKNLARYRASFDFDAIVELRDEMKRIRAKLEKLGEQNAKLWSHEPSARSAADD